MGRGFDLGGGVVIGGRMQRVVEEELLDGLKEGDPDALHNRRDILLINRIQGNYRWLGRQLRRRVQVGDHGLEMGAGAGDLGFYLARKSILPENVQYDGLDLWSRPEGWPEGWGWNQEDATGLRAIPYDFVVGNLIFHQFEDHILQEWGKLLRRNCRLILACEPVRHARHLRQLKLLRPLRLHPISWHDAEVSIRAGFRGWELPSLLGLEKNEWKIHLEETFWGSYRMRAERLGELPSLVPETAVCPG